MADLESLGYKSITEMQQEEALALILGYRNARRVKKAVKKKAKATTTKRKPAKPKTLASKLKNLSKAQLAELLEALE